MDPKKINKLNWLASPPLGIIETTCKSFLVDPLILVSLIYTESRGNQFATRYEGGFHFTSNLAKWARHTHVLEQTELVGQKTSWGLMQVMGGTAREMGFDGNFPQLCDAGIGIKYGAMYYWRQMERYKDPMQAVAAYNAGSVRMTISGEELVNQNYVDKVFAVLKEISN